LTPADVAERFGLAKPDGVYALIRSGQLAAVNVGSDPNGRPTWRIAEADLLAFLAARRPRPTMKRTPRRKGAARRAGVKFF
jgi:hypothetical protein